MAGQREHHRPHPVDGRGDAKRVRSAATRGAARPAGSPRSSTRRPMLPRWRCPVRRSVATYSTHTTGLGDEGGLPALAAPEECLEIITSAITDAGYLLGMDGIGIALDPAASEYRQDGTGHPGHWRQAVQR